MKVPGTVQMAVMDPGVSKYPMLVVFPLFNAYIGWCTVMDGQVKDYMFCIASTWFFPVALTAFSVDFGALAIKLTTQSRVGR